MRKLLFTASIIICITCCVNAQKVIKIDKDKFSELASLQSTIDLLYDYRDVFNKVYSGIESWIFLSPDWRERSNLFKTINIVYPQTLEELKDQMHHASNIQSSAVTDTLFSDVFRLTEHARTVMDKFKKFEDYDENPTLLLREQRIFESEFTALFRKINIEFDSVFDGKQRRFVEVQEALLIRSGKNKLKVTDKFLQNIKLTVDRLNNMQSVKQFGWKISTGAIAWAFIENEELRTSTKTYLSDSILIRQQLKTPMGYSLFQQEVIKGIFTDLDTLLKDCRQIIEGLSSQESFEDPLAKLLAEDEADSQLRPHYENVSQSIDLLLYGTRSDLQLLLATPDEANSLRKRSDIIELLKSGDNLLTIVRNQKARLQTKEVSMANSALDKIKTEDLIQGLIPIYDRLFTHEEIKEILKFQKSAAGKKMQENALVLSVEIVLYVRNYIEKLLEDQKRFEPY